MHILEILLVLLTTVALSWRRLDRAYFIRLGSFFMEAFAPPLNQRLFFQLIFTF